MKPGHPALQYIRLVQDSFEIPGYMGPHLCLVYEPMREPLWLLQRRFSDDLYSFPLLLYTVKFLLTGLACLHDECNVIHTGLYRLLLVKPTLTLLNSDLKPENILVGLEKTFSLDCVVQDEIDSPSPRKYLLDRTIYLSRNDFGHPKSTPGRPKIADFDSTVRVTASQNTFTHPIQPNGYRAPEVILGAQWSYPVDVWNLGVMVHLVLPFGFSSLLTTKNLHTALGSPGGHCSL